MLLNLDKICNYNFLNWVYIYIDRAFSFDGGGGDVGEVVIIYKIA
jgi:hypothetical protein